MSPRSITAVAILVAVGFGAGWFLGPDATVSDDLAPAGRDGEVPVLRSNGIAVLPFVTRSVDDPSTRFFAGGLHDDLLTGLAGVPELVVISRTSVEQYRDTDLSIPEIGEELAVAWVLEGGVQQAGDRLRVNAQLIDARTDEHLWAETLDDLVEGWTPPEIE